VSTQEDKRYYWRQNIRYVTALLSIWFTVSFLCGIVFVDALDKIQFGGFKLGFWFAQQGAIYVFVVLIFVYVRLMTRLEDKVGLAEPDEIAKATVVSKSEGDD
jgi:putative solute:sodium symporter small subunit